MAKALELEDQLAAIAKKYSHAKNFLFMGRQANYPIALEGALKLKEVSYIAASGYPSAELKHGVIALVNEETPSVFIAPRDAVFEKNLSNIEEVKARKGPVIAVGTEGDQSLAKIADDVIYIPKAPDYLTPILSVNSPAAAGLLHCCRARLRRGQASKPCQECDRRIIDLRQQIIFRSGEKKSARWSPCLNEDRRHLGIPGPHAHSSAGSIRV